MDNLSKLRFLREQEELERVSPKMELWRAPAMIKLARGGRGSGAKSWGAASLAIQRAHRSRLRIACLREFQKSLEESAYALFVDTIARLRYPGWKITKESIDSRCGSHIIFRGLKDYHHATQAKGLEKFDVFLLEEASAISRDSLSLVLPTLFRTTGSELWAVYNQELDPDPIDDIVWNRDYESIIRVEMLPGAVDNPWWNPELQKLMDADYAYDPDLAEHTWGGLPRKQGQKAVWSRAAVRGAMTRLVPAEGEEQLGVDVARFGDDATKLYKRRGMRVIEVKTFQGQDTQRTAREAWDMVNRRPYIPIKVDDTGVGGGVTDKLRDLGARVIPINFGGTPRDQVKYSSVADEMWFEFPMNEAQIPDDPELTRQLTGRLYDYDKKDRRVIESKKDYKKRCGRSPDDADALLLCFYSGHGIVMDARSRAEMAARRRR